MKLATLSLLTLVSLSSPALANDCYEKAIARAEVLMADIEDLTVEISGLSPGSQSWRKALCTQTNKMVSFTQASQEAFWCKNDDAGVAEWQRQEQKALDEARSMGCK